MRQDNIVTARLNQHLFPYQKILMHRNLTNQKNFKYLEVMINDEWHTSNEIKYRMEMARNAFFKYNGVLVRASICS